ncbi:MAG: AAA family ATPase [Eubacteriales bacterium]|nr:AAA family ATPase [Eubacteriales bacterium]
MKIAVSGKGGVGKTTIASNLAKLFVKEGFRVYAVDADADSSLGLALGIDEKELEKMKPMIEMKDLIGEIAGEGALYRLNPEVDSIICRYSIDFKGIQFLRMGGIKKGGSSCYCRENTFLKALMNSLIMDTQDIVILDMGAGIEHLTRGTSANVDLMLVITEPGKSSVQTARIVEGLAKDLGVKEVLFIANKVRTVREREFIDLNFKQSELLGILDYDEEIAERAMGYGQLSEMAANQELEDLLYKIIYRAKAEQ